MSAEPITNFSKSSGGAHFPQAVGRNRVNIVWRIEFKRRKQNNTAGTTWKPGMARMTRHRNDQ
jgi:hypothetical protein